jgi:CRP-like cAMP-binding protein
MLAGDNLLARVVVELTEGPIMTLAVDAGSDPLANPLFAASAPQDLTELRDVGQCRIHPVGTLVTRRDSAPTEVHVVVWGAVELSRRIGDRVGTVSIVHAGGSFNDGPLLAGRPVRYDARTLETTELLTIPGSELLRLISHQRRFSLRWLQAIAERSEGLESRLVELLTQDLDNRLVRLLLDEAEHDVIELSQTVMARLLGAHRTSINRALKSLEQAGLIRVRYRNIELIDPAGLRANAGIGDRRDRALAAS